MPYDKFTSVAELRADRQKLVESIERMHVVAGDSPLEGADFDKFNALNAKLDDIDEALEQRQRREERVRAISQRPENREAGSQEGGSRRRDEDEDAPVHLRMSRDQAFRTIERYAGKQYADDRIDKVVRTDPSGWAARYIAAIGDPAYATAFHKLLADPQLGHLRFGPRELEAFRLVSAVQAEQRALTTTTTGIPIPYELDPTVMISGSGALNPIRQIARVETVSEGTVKFATSAEVSAGYAAEPTEASDNTPAMLQPTITAAPGQAFVPFSYESGQDWSTLVDNLSRLLLDGRDVLDATQFLTGTGSNAPGGILNIGGTGGLTTTQRVLSAGAGAVAIGDVYALKQAEPARFFANATFAVHPTRLDAIYRLVAAGSTTEPQIMADGRNGPLLGKPVVEWSTMTTAIATGSKWALFGDFRQFLIADRLGATVKLIPDLFGASLRPTGQSGLYLFWRTGTGALVPNAFRYGETS
jgi:HK97 family phage major capsid protein